MLKKMEFVRYLRFTISYGHFPTLFIILIAKFIINNSLYLRVISDARSVQAEEKEKKLKKVKNANK